MTEDRRAVIDGLRAFATFLEDNPDAPTPNGPTRFDVFLYTKESFRTAAKTVGGKLDKKDYGELMALRKEFGPIQYDLNIAREEVCERVVTGKRTVGAVPAHEEDVIEWKCGKVLE